MTQEKDRLIFMHLPKCGGMSFKSVLRRSYPARHTFEIRVIKNVGNNLDKLSRMPLNKKKQLKLVLGHVEFGLHSKLPGDWEYVTFLRDPVDRIISYYSFVKRNPNHRLHLEGKFHDRMSLREFVNTIDEPDIHNGQIRFISGIQASPEIMLQKAEENLSNHFSYVGTIKCFDESLLLLQQKYNWPFPYFSVKNKTKKRPPKKLIDPKVLEEIREKNKEDIKLYEQVSAKQTELISCNSQLLQAKEKLKRNSKLLRLPLLLFDAVNILLFR